MMCLVCGLGCVWSDQGVVCGSGMWPMVWEYIGLWFRVYVVCDVRGCMWSVVYVCGPVCGLIHVVWCVSVGVFVVSCM